MTVLIALVIFSLTKTLNAQSSCTSPNGEIAICIPIKECKIFLDVLKNGVRPPSNVTDFLRESSCGFENGPLVCCGNFNHPIKSTPPNADPRKHKNFNLLPKNCGLQEIDERVLRVETEAQLEEFPWMALLEYNLTDSPRNTNFHCGGTLINSQYVLTVAHCTIRDIPFSVRLGDHDLTTEIDCRKKIDGNQNFEICTSGYEDIPIERIIRHVDYNRRKRKNNIALLRLVRPATISNPFGSNVKLKAQLPIVALDKCSKIYGKNDVNITEQHLCAGGEADVDACQGDSGNALVPPKWVRFRRSGIWKALLVLVLVVGLVSHPFSPGFLVILTGY